MTEQPGRDGGQGGTPNYLTPGYGGPEQPERPAPPPPAPPADAGGFSLPNAEPSPDAAFADRSGHGGQGGGGQGGGGQGGGQGSASEIAGWVTANYTAQTVDGVTVYDLSVSS
jgi:hypothetical protein